MTSICVHERSVCPPSLSQDYASLKVSLSLFFLNSTQRGKMWPWIASLLSQSYDRKVKRKEKIFLLAFLEVEGRTSYINPDRFCPFVSMDCKYTVIGNMLKMFLIMLYWNDKLNWLGMCVSKNNVQFCLVSMCWGLNWHSDSCFFDSEWECVSFYEREIISQSLALHLHESSLLLSTGSDTPFQFHTCSQTPKCTPPLIVPVYFHTFTRTPPRCHSNSIALHYSWKSKLTFTSASID